VHNAYRLALDGPSLRKPEAAEFADPQKGLPMKEEAGAATVPETKPAKGGRK